MNQKGFTIKELLMVIVVIGILCVAAIPQFYAMQNSRRQTQMETLINQLQRQIVAHKTEEISAVAHSMPRPKVFPKTLDQEPSNQACKNCFSLVLDKGVKNPLWFKVSDSEYLYSRNGNTKDKNDYIEEGNFRIKYDNQSGILIATSIE